MAVKTDHGTIAHPKEAAQINNFSEFQETLMRNLDTQDFPEGRISVVALRHVSEMISRH